VHAVIRRGHGLALAALLAAACTRSDRQVPRPALAVVVQARTPEGRAVPELRAWADGRELGSTHADGALHATLRGAEGQRVVLAFACPASHRTLDPRRELWLRAPRPLEGTRSPALALAVRCEPIERAAALVVRARGPRSTGLPVRVQGEVLAQTARDGTAHLLIAARAQSTLRVTLDTSAVPALRPANPVHTFELGGEDRLLLFEQRFRMEARAPILRQRPLQRPHRID
jgi:hypothetical protein